MYPSDLYWLVFETQLLLARMSGLRNKGLCVADWGDGMSCSR